MDSTMVNQSRRVVFKKRSPMEKCTERSERYGGEKAGRRFASDGNVQVDCV